MQRLLKLASFLSLASFSCGVATAQNAPQAFPLHGNSQLKAVGVRQAQAVLVADDRFTTELSRFDMESRMGRLNVSRKDFDRFVSDSVLPWDPELLNKVRAAAGTVRKWIDAQQLSVPFPKEILLIHTTGKEEGNAAYCRGAAIVLPAPLLKKSRPQRLNSLMAHELFHILSANNEPLRRQLYATIGFQACPRVALPRDLAPRKLTNPDGPGLDYFIQLQEAGSSYRAVPLLLASVERYDPKRGGTFFKYLQFQLMAVEPDGEESWRPLMADGKPRMFDPEKTESFFKQVGRNTNYIVHPDEILADNFVFLLQGKKDLKSPQVVEQMRKVLSATK